MKFFNLNAAPHFIFLTQSPVALVFTPRIPSVLLDSLQPLLFSGIAGFRQLRSLFQSPNWLNEAVQADHINKNQQLKRSFTLRPEASS
jgi:hypothetical protein